MRKSLLAATVAGAVAAAFAWSAGAGSPPGPAQDRVYGGGALPASCTDGNPSFCGAAREFSVLAVSNPVGGGAYGTVSFGFPGLGRFTTARVTCLAVHGAIAEIGGVITGSDDPSVVGGPYQLFVRDSGTPGTANRDGVSPNLIDVATAPQATCGDVDTNVFGSGSVTLQSGDVVVEDS